MRRTLTATVLTLTFMSLTVLSGESAGKRGTALLDECAPDTLRVAEVSGRVVYELKRGETPLDEAVVSLKRGGNLGPVIAKQAIKSDGSFSFGNVKHGKYQIEVAAPGLRNFYLDLEVGRLKSGAGRKEIIVIMGTDFAAPCAGSRAELRVVKKEAE